MRAFAVRSLGEAPAIHDLPIPSEHGAFLIRVRYAGLNPIDYKLVERLTAASTYPFVMGADFAGVIERVPEGERDLRPGDRVFGMARTHGAYAECTAVAPAAKQNRWRVSRTASLTNRQRHYPYRQLLRSARSSCWASPRASASL